jgi:hypothetical protein
MIFTMNLIMPTKVVEIVVFVIIEVDSDQKYAGFTVRVIEWS